MTVSG